MSDFNDFEGADQAQTEEDPAAAFLAREQEELAEIEGETFALGDGSTQAADASQEVPPVSSDDLLNEFGGSSEPQLDGTLSSNLQDQGGLFDTYGTTQDSSDFYEQDSYSAISQVDRQRQEPEKIRLWREEQKTILEQKDAEAETKKGEWREAAKQELADWYKHRAEQFEKAKVNNREAEAVFIKERDESIPGHEWERICRLCDFNPKASRNQKDVSRMRSILLQLKQTTLVR